MSVCPWYARAQSSTSEAVSRRMSCWLTWIAIWDLPRFCGTRFGASAGDPAVGGAAARGGFRYAVIGEPPFGDARADCCTFFPISIFAMQYAMLKTVTVKTTGSL